MRAIYRGDKKCFGYSISRNKKTKTLAQQAQILGETGKTYREEELKLCSLAIPEMSDENKAGHVLKGIAKCVYKFLITKKGIA